MYWSATYKNLVLTSAFKCFFSMKDNRMKLYDKYNPLFFSLFSGAVNRNVLVYRDVVLILTCM